jgi:hypothetical protein
MRSAFLPLGLALALAGCGDEPDPPVCEDARVPFRTALGCEAELLAQATRPLDSALPGAITIKTVVDRAQDDRVTFQDTAAYPVHSRFAIEHLGWPPGAPFVDQYYAPSRRFLLGSVTHYAEPDVFVYELAPYDTASTEMIDTAFRQIAAATYFGGELRFHPTSEEQIALAAGLPADIPVIRTDELRAAIGYRPIALGETYARVRVLAAADLPTAALDPRDLAVLDRLPAALPVLAGAVSQEPPAPLAHAAVRSQERATPCMGLADAMATFAALDGRWVRLSVRAFDWEVAEVTAAEADAWWTAHPPATAAVPDPDYTVTGLVDVDDATLADLPAIGATAAHHAALRDAGAMVRARDAIAIPVVFYRDFLADHGFDTRIATLLADPMFRADPAIRGPALAALATDMVAAPIDPADRALIEARLDQEFPASPVELRASTNAESCAGCATTGLYARATGVVGSATEPIDVAIKTVWASAWRLDAFDERERAAIDHARVAIGVLVQPAAVQAGNGVAISANIYDPAPGGEDAFHVEAQIATGSVVAPAPGAAIDALTHYYFHANQPATVYTRSSLAGGTLVLSRARAFELAQALAAIRQDLGAIYDPPAGYGQLPVAVEWRLVDEGGEVHVWIDSAHPYPGRGN